MKRSVSNSVLCAYLGAFLLIACYYPGLNAELERVRILHALWHVAIFIAAALIVFGLETLRRQASLTRRTTS